MVWGLGFRVWGLRAIRVWGLGFRIVVYGLEVGVLGILFRVHVRLVVGHCFGFTPLEA